MGYDNDKKRGNDGSILRWIGRFLLVAVILMITSFVTPGFTINGIWSFLIAAVVISGLDYLVESFMGIDAYSIWKRYKRIFNCSNNNIFSAVFSSSHGSIYFRSNISSCCYWNVRCSISC